MVNRSIFERNLVELAGHRFLCPFCTIGRSHYCTQLVIRWNFEPAKSVNPTINSFRSKVTNSSWRQEGTFLTSPGEKSRELTEKSCVRFPLPQNCRPPHERRRSGWFKHSTRRGWISSKRTCSVQYVKDEQGRLRHDMQLIRDPWVQCSALYSILQ